MIFREERIAVVQDFLEACTSLQSKCYEFFPAKDVFLCSLCRATDRNSRMDHKEGCPMPNIEGAIQLLQRLRASECAAVVNSSE